MLTRCLDWLPKSGRQNHSRCDLLQDSERGHWSLGSFISARISLSQCCRTGAHGEVCQRDLCQECTDAEALGRQGRCEVCCQDRVTFARLVDKGNARKVTGLGRKQRKMHLQEENR